MEQHDNTMCQKQTHFHKPEAITSNSAKQDQFQEDSARVSENSDKTYPSDISPVQEPEERGLHTFTLAPSGIKL